MGLVHRRKKKSPSAFCVSVCTLCQPPHLCNLFCLLANVCFLINQEHLLTFRFCTSYLLISIFFSDAIRNGSKYKTGEDLEI